jgi:hypothetical protein
MILATEFEITVLTNIEHVSAAVAHVAPLFAEETLIRVTSLNYEHMTSYGQSVTKPLGCTIKGKAWRTIP